MDLCRGSTPLFVLESTIVKARLIAGDPGSGKTETVIDEIVTCPALYLIAAPTKRQIRETISRIKAEAQKASVDLNIHALDSDQETSMPVARAISDLPRLHHDGHVVIVVTHTSLMEADLSGFTGWRLVIDENPDAVVNGTMVIPVTSAIFDKVYSLTPASSTGWYHVGVWDEAKFVEVEADDILKGTPLHRRVRQGRVFVDVPSWAKLGGTRKAVNWYSSWSLHEAFAFDAVTVVGASVAESLLVRASQGVEFIVEDASKARKGHPHVIIRYYADGHTGSTEFWTKTLSGRRCIDAVAEDLSKRSIGFWSCNDDIAGPLSGIRGRKITPKVAGTNLFRTLRSCAFVYSSKALPSDVALRVVFGLTDDEIKRIRETEDIWQFIWRGVIRNIDFDGTYTVYLYDREQARTLAAMLARVGISSELELIQTAAAGVTRSSKPGRKSVKGTAMTAAERKQRQREKKRKMEAARASFGGLA